VCRMPPALLLALVASSTPIVTASNDGDVVSQKDFQRVVARFEEHAARTAHIVEKLQTGLGSLQADNTALRRRVDSLQELVAMLESGNAVLGTDEPGRRLTSGPTYVAVNAKQIHEFPNGHSCSNTGFVESHPKLVAVGSSGPSLSAGPTVASADVSMASVTAKDWTVNEIQRIAAPLKVVHDASCANPPTLDLPLSTTVSGSLTVGSVNVGTTLSTLTAAGSWTDVPIDTSAWQYRSERMQYLVKNGVVHLRGGVGSILGGSINNDDTVAQLPIGARPSQMGCFSGAGFDRNWLSVVIKTDGGIQVKGGGGNGGNTGNNVYMDGISFPLA